MTSLGGLEGIAFVNTKYANTSIDWPDIQFHLAPASKYQKFVKTKIQHLSVF